MFSKQEYPNKELIILDDSPQPMKKIPKLSNVTYIHSTRRQNIGIKRNKAVKIARGDIFVFWDDDDIYSPRRLSLQITPLLKKSCDITVFGNMFYAYDDADTIYCTSLQDHKKIWYKGYCCGTIASKKHVWDLVKFPRIPIGEDREFIKYAESSGFKVCMLKNKLDYIRTMHSGNTFVLPSNVQLKQAV